MRCQRRHLGSNTIPLASTNANAIADIETKSFSIAFADIDTNAFSNNCPRIAVWV
jgi:hypothetical protein